MARRAGPSARSRRLARSLRRLRVDAGLSTNELAEELGVSSSKISRLETAELGIYQDDLERFLDFYEVPKTRRVELLDIARKAEQRGWLRMRNPNFPTDWQTWSDFEDEASALLHYEPLMLTGLLQTSEYARTIIEATGHDMADSEVDALVASRMARQGLLTRKPPVQLHTIIEEHVLTRPFGSDGAMGRQLRYLAEVASWPNITIQIIPRTVGFHPGMDGPFIILEYDDEPSLVWLENKLASLFLDEDEQVETYASVWQDLKKLARTSEESTEVLLELARANGG